MATFVAFIIRAYAWLQSSWLGRMFLKHVRDRAIAYGGLIYRLIKSKIYRDNRSKKQEEAKKKYDEVIKDPTKTPDDRGKAYEDYHNSGR